MLPKSVAFASAQIEEVISDTELRLKSEFMIPSKDGNSNVKATQRVRTDKGSESGWEYKVLPHVDQEETYGAVFKRLNEGGCIGIFPEGAPSSSAVCHRRNRAVLTCRVGGSHDRTDFLPLKAGFSIMALGAIAANPGLDVKLVPVGLSYFHPHKFRSRAVVEFGPPISVDPEYVEMYKQGGAKKREACGKLLEQVHDGLRAVTLRGPDWETMQVSHSPSPSPLPPGGMLETADVKVIQAARRLYRIPGQHLTLGQVVQLSKRFMEGYLHYQHEPRIQDLRKRVIAYNRLLRDMGIADHQVERASNRSVKSLLLLVYRTGLLLWWTFLSLPGVILHAPVFILAKTISHKKAKGACCFPQGRVSCPRCLGATIPNNNRSPRCVNRQDPGPGRAGHLESARLARRRAVPVPRLRPYRNLDRVQVRDLVRLRAFRPIRHFKLLAVSGHCRFKVWRGRHGRLQVSFSSLAWHSEVELS